MDSYTWVHGGKIKFKDEDVGITDIEIVDAISESDV